MLLLLHMVRWCLLAALGEIVERLANLIVMIVVSSENAQTQNMSTHIISKVVATKVRTDGKYFFLLQGLKNFGKN